MSGELQTTSAQEARKTRKNARLAEQLEGIRKLEHVKVNTARVNEVNDRVAVLSTLIFGSMWMFYAFFCYGFLPLLPQLSKFQDKFLYWGSWIQLWALPLLMVGGIVLNRSTEKRAAEDHLALMSEIEEIKEMHTEVLELVRCIRDIEAAVCPKPETTNAASGTVQG